jgi:hypothetical protein
LWRRSLTPPGQEVSGVGHRGWTDGRLGPRQCCPFHTRSQVYLKSLRPRYPQVVETCSQTLPQRILDGAPCSGKQRPHRGFFLAWTTPARRWDELNPTDRGVQAVKGSHERGIEIARSADPDDLGKKSKQRYSTRETVYASVSWCCQQSSDVGSTAHHGCLEAKSSTEISTHHKPHQSGA